MKIGIALGLLSPKYWTEVTEAADALGFDSLWMPDHLVFPTDMSGSPFPGEDHMPVPPNTKLYDAFCYLCYLSARTRTIRLGTNVYLLGLRHPFIAARAIATLDILSGGRAAIGVGAGWLKQEWQVSGMDPATRGRRLDEALALCKRLWIEEKISHEGEFYSFAEVMFEPKPTQKPHPPLYIGGESPAALSRVVRLGDGWLGVHHTPDSIQAPIQALQALCRQQGRMPESVAILTQGQCNTPEELSQWRASGVDELIITPWKEARQAVRSIEAFAQWGLAC